MAELADKQPSDEVSALTGGCLLLLVLVADVAAGLLVAVVLVARGWNRMGAGSGRTAAGVPSPDWGPVLGFGGLALALGVTAVLLLRVGHRVIGAVQLTLCVFLAVHTLRSWP
ncbi:inner-membrane translocator [Streptomyces massasporeus]|uniref:inner-membrane translocator n=1 Tax=Streptomyces massasporeus TaxID=67324 RepID=UPI00369C4BB1